MRYLIQALTLILLFLSQTLFAEQPNSIRVIIKYKFPNNSAISLKTELASATGLPVQQLQPMAGGAYLATLDARPLEKTALTNTDPSHLILARLRKNPNLVYAVKDRVGQFTPQPPLHEEQSFLAITHDLQWDEFSRPGGIMLESAPGLRDGAWAYTTGRAATPIVVAVLDTGIAIHNNLINNLLKDQNNNLWGWNFSANNDDLTDETESFHGTHVAGTIAAYGGVMIGIGEDLKILPVKIPDASGMFYESQVINGIRWAVGDHIPGVPDNPYPAKVLNMSFGVDEYPGKEIEYCDEALQDAITYARNQGAVIVVAAGNDDRWEHYNAPGVCNGTIKVAATGPEGLRAYYSNYGPGVTLAAPGGDLEYGKKGGILSTVKPYGGYMLTGFDFYQGTSMASPHVAGVAGLIFAVSEQQPTPEWVEQILYATTHSFGLSHDPNMSCVDLKPCGHGILDADYAMKATINQFNLILSAPTPSLEPSAPGWMQRLSDRATQYWKPIHAKQLVRKPTQQPHVYLGSDQRIYAQSGLKTYQLDETKVQDCQIIGFDGIGCHQSLE